MRFRITTVAAGPGVATQEWVALDEADARRQAAVRGLRVVAVQPVRWKPAGRARLALVPFSNELVALLQAGLSLVEAIDALTEKERDPAVRHLLAAVRQRLGEGQALSTALGEHPGTFPPLYVATVRATERSGAVAEALRRFVAYQEQVDRLRKKLVSASIYPAVLLVAGALVLLFLVAYVVPRFSGIYEEVGGELPLASRVLMGWGRLLDAHGPAVLTALAAAAALAAWGLSRPGLRALAGRLVARIPLVGERLHVYQLARLYRTVGMLLRGGLPVVTAFEMTGGLLAPAARPRLAAATRAVREGRSLAEALAAEGLTTPVSERMLRVGEKSGEMGEMMERIAAFHDEDLARFVDLATRLVEPALMAVIGLVIGVVVVLMYLPIFELAGAVR
jgi:general secretion pathway protein F